MSHSLDRRSFLRLTGSLASACALSPRLRNAIADISVLSPAMEDKPYGSGHFGMWIEDEFGLPAFHYICDQIHDSKAVTPVDPEFRSPTDQTHQVGNDRLVAAVSNCGYVQVRQDEGSPKFLNDYCSEKGQYGGGIGFLTDGRISLSTFYPGSADRFERVFGIGYLRKTLHFLYGYRRASADVEAAEEGEGRRLDVSESHQERRQEDETRSDVA